MALYFVKTEMRTTIAYVINSKDELTKEKVQEAIEEGHSFKDFTQQTGDEIVTECFTITPDTYLATFDAYYPEMKNIDRTSKFLQISDIDDKVLDEMLSTEKDEY